MQGKLWVVVCFGFFQRIVLTGKKENTSFLRLCSMWTCELEDMFRPFCLAGLSEPTFCKFLKSLLEPS